MKPIHRTLCTWKLRVVTLMAVCAVAGAHRALAASALQLPDFKPLERLATESVNITPDPSLLTIVARFLDASDPQDAAAKKVIQGLQGIYVRSFTFDADGAY
jgi:hypothetical protein